MMLPTRKPTAFSNTVDRFSQATASLPSPFRSSSARPSFTSQVSASFTSCSALRLAANSFCRRAATLSVTTFSSPFAFCSAASLVAAASSAPASFAFFGSISLLTRPYTSIARTHMHSDIAAADTFFTTSGWKSSLFVYFCIFSVFFLSFASASLSYVFRSSKKVDLFISFFAESQFSFSPMSRQTACKTTSTRGGGLAKDLISVMSFLSSASSALMAL
mmetsp:Transcript_22101/g.55726  ORF Transcript_22101/g.55726 Transcript_22101/m.55726 type:complete len:219 (-) Transcript_22101:1052-1708(-)